MSRCARMPFNAATRLYGSMPMCVKRPSTSNTLLACTVVNTRCPVSAACTAICAVSGSRISPTMIFLGQRRIQRRRFAAARRSGDEKHSVRLGAQAAHFAHCVVAEAEEIETQPAHLVGQSLFVEDAQHRVLALDARHHGYAEIDLPAAPRYPEASILRNTPLRDI